MREEDSGNTTRSFLFPQNLRGFPLEFASALCQYIDMVCIYCQSPTQTINTRKQLKSNNIWRRRRCLKCGAIFTTIERIDTGKAMVINGNTDALLPLSRDELFIKLYESCRHRPAAVSDAATLTDTILGKLFRSTKHGAVDEATFRKTVLAALRHFDRVAETYYQAYYTL